jgi:hypothetical protein
MQTLNTTNQTNRVNLVKTKTTRTLGLIIARKAFISDNLQETRSNE